MGTRLQEFVRLADKNYEKWLDITTMTSFNPPPLLLECIMFDRLLDLLSHARQFCPSEINRTKSILPNFSVQQFLCLY